MKTPWPPWLAGVARQRTQCRLDQCELHALLGRRAAITNLHERGTPRQRAHLGDIRGEVEDVERTFRAPASAEAEHEKACGLQQRRGLHFTLWLSHERSERGDDATHGRRKGFNAPWRLGAHGTVGHDAHGLAQRKLDFSG